MQPQMASARPVAPQHFDTDVAMNAGINDHLPDALNMLASDARAPGEVAAKIKAQGSSLGKTLRALSRSKLHLAKYREQAAELSKGVTPSGMKPVKLPFD